MTRQAEQSGVNIGFAPTFRLRSLGQLVEGGLEVKLAINRKIGIVHRDRRKLKPFGHAPA
jgi:hypothetical protein